MPQFVLHTKDIDESGKDYAFALSSEWLNAALKDCELKASESSAGASLTVHAHRLGTDILVRGRIHADLSAECRRCLGEASMTVDTELVSLFVAKGADLRPPPDEIELTPEELDRTFYSGDHIALDDIVREQLILECPMQPLCREDCPGIAVPENIRGADVLHSSEKEKRSLDPRLAPLQMLTGKVSSKKE